MAEIKKKTWPNSFQENKRKAQENMKRAEEERRKHMKASSPMSYQE